MEIKRFLIRGGLFSSPFLLWATFIFLVDPFDYFDRSRLIPEPVKTANAAELNELMFNMLKEVHNPSENLIIGDSRAALLSLDYIKEVTGQDYHRLTSNAAKLNEAIDLFYFANRRRHLAHAVVAINFNQYNEYAFADRVHSVEAVIHNPLLYIFDRSVAQASYYVAKAALTKKKAFSSIPPMTRDEFWQFIVNVRAREHYGKYRYPAALFKRLQDMAQFAKDNGTQITFIIVPHHQDFQQRVEYFGLTEERNRFYRDIATLGVKAVDYDYPNEITSDKANFRDPIHYDERVGRLIVDEVFGNKLKVGHLVSRQ